MTLAIDARDVVKTYGVGEAATQVLKGVDFLVKKGEFVFLAGPSGSGKTTFLSILGCVLTATSGDVSLLGTRISGRKESDLPSLRVAYLGFIFQGHNLIASLTAAQNIALQLELRGHSPRAAMREAEALLDRVGLGDRTHHKPGELSGGQRQRVSVARALAGGPPIILADEPTASLDAQSGLLVTEMLREMVKERGHSVVAVTHDNRIYHLADRVVQIEDGRITGESS
jgi:putative ABC transport system ATP-binding protein